MNLKEKVAGEKPKIPPVCLTVAGLDPSGGAGIVADIETFSAFGCHATCAVTSLTFQNTTGVFGAIHQTAAAVRGQIEPILADYTVAAVKTGMLPTVEVIEETARIIREHKLSNLVVDPVVRSTSGFDLIDDDALRSLIEQLFPLALIVTPNLPEAERITRMKIETESDITRAARMMQDFGAKNVLIKGGHLLAGNLNAADLRARDYLFTAEKTETFEAEFINSNATHGTGCTLSAAMAANLAAGENLARAVEISKKFVTEAIRRAPDLGNGHPSVNRLLKGFS